MPFEKVKKRRPKFKLNIYTYIFSIYGLLRNTISTLNLNIIYITRIQELPHVHRVIILQSFYLSKIITFRHFVTIYRNKILILSQEKKWI